MPQNTPWSDRLPAAAGPRMAAWLTDGGLLTPRLKSRVPSGFRLRVIDEYRRGLDADERALLGTGCDEAQVREITMSNGADAVVLAASIIPSATLRLFPDLARLGERPLGDTLSGRDDVRRQPFEYAMFEPGEPGYPPLPEGMPPERLFARRSVIRVASSPILVLEYFRTAVAAVGEPAR